MNLARCCRKWLWFCAFLSNPAHRKDICKCLILLLVVCIYYGINVGWTGSLNSYLSQGRPCHNSIEEDNDLYYLLKVSHRILNKYDLDPFLCYGSLWGAIRLNNPLPWDYDFDIGILYEDLKKLSIKDIKNDFQKAGIDFFYQRWAGNYKVKKGRMTGDIMLFVKNKEKVQRMGIESWVLFLHYRLYHSFPSKLIEKPLPKVEFANVHYSVPKEGIEIQKYLYPKDWWKVLSPNGCNFTYPTVEVGLI